LLKPPGQASVGPVTINATITVTIISRPLRPPAQSRAHFPLPLDPAAQSAQVAQSHFRISQPIVNRSLTMAQRLHLVFGGELVDPAKNVFRDVDNLDIVGMFPNYASAFDAWKAAAQKTVDNAHMRYFIAHIHRLRDEEVEVSTTEELGH
tara:strand:- start:11343 stop:11792 length:450 start_codon:yes stop_codon:yes gene_type:complete